MSTTPDPAEGSSDSLKALLPLALELTAALSGEEREARLIELVQRALPCDAVALLRLEDEDLVPSVAEVVGVRRESADVVTLRVKSERLAGFGPGQFTQLSLPGVGEAPISISGEEAGAIEHTIRGLVLLGEGAVAVEGDGLLRF